ncbi:signal peptidase I [Bacillus wiedmannii]|nr:signal peptidase I [Bacillus wiedmannii]PFZ59582.1 signal peptidase I [Bacillus wiedmannii]PHB64264.1 signal peptidase I [Bacillus wiedmannii]PHE04595.1 signal peptidase I [Bacillus wiedmannii]PHG63707.1 signal peptidase I [Bacillus wiedmannii]
MKNLKNIILFVFFSLIFTSIINIFIIQLYKVDGHSMEPTLFNTETVIISKLSNILSYQPKYNDIVIIDTRIKKERNFKDILLESNLVKIITNKSNNNIYIKRVIGKPGDLLEFKDNHIYRNGKELKETYIKEPMIFNGEKTLTVPKEHFFVMGDNRNHSTDSRTIGFIPISHILGKKL